MHAGNHSTEMRNELITLLDYMLGTKNITKADYLKIVKYIK